MNGAKEGTSMKNPLYEQWAPFRLKRRLIAKKSSPVVFAIVNIIRQSVSQSAENSIKYILLKIP